MARPAMDLRRVFFFFFFFKLILGEFVHNKKDSERKLRPDFAISNQYLKVLELVKLELNLDEDGDEERERKVC